MLIVGSQALHKILPTRKPADLDIIVPMHRVEEAIEHFKTIRVKSSINLITDVKRTENVITLKRIDGLRIELLIALPGTAFWMYLQKYNAFDGVKTIDAQGLFSLKKSHVHIPLKFDKHIKDYCVLNKMVKGIDTMPEITKQNTQDIKDRVGKHFKSPSLNKTVKEFFGQSEGKVHSYFIHDHIHEVMAHYDRPLYEKMQRDLKMAKCEKDLWDKFSYHDKMRCVLEEAYVIALERKILPVMYGGETPYFSPKKALEWAMMRVCTTLTGGWFRKFATEYYVEIMAFADDKYVTKFLTSVDKGEIKFLKKKKKECMMA